MNLAGQLEDYQSQSKMLLQELEKKDREIDRLKDMQGDQNEDVGLTRLLEVVLVVVVSSK